MEKYNNILAEAKKLIEQLPNDQIYALDISMNIVKAIRSKEELLITDNDRLYKALKILNSTIKFSYEDDMNSLLSGLHDYLARDGNDNDFLISFVAKTIAREFVTNRADIFPINLLAEPYYQLYVKDKPIVVEGHPRGMYDTPSDVGHAADPSEWFDQGLPIKPS